MNNKLVLKIKRMAKDKDWRTREEAANKIKELNDSRFEEYLPLWKRWVKDANPNIRRAVEVGLLRIDKKYFQEAFELLLPLLYDGDPYVRKNCGSFELSAIAYRNPAVAFTRFRALIKEKDKTLLWNIAMCLGAIFGMKYPHQSLELLRILVKDKRRFVWRAAASSLIKLLRKYPKYRKEVYTWQNTPHVLDVIERYV